MQDLHTVSPAKTPAWMWEGGAQEVPALDAGLLATVAAREAESVFSRDKACERLPWANKQSPPTHMWASLSELTGVSESVHEVGRGKWWKAVEETLEGGHRR